MQRCRAGAEVVLRGRCTDMQRWCRCAEVVQRWYGGAELKSCRGAMMQEQVQRWCAELQR